METGLPESAPDPKPRWRLRLPRWPIVAEASVFLIFTVFFLLYGVVPVFGGAGMGLLGADEPRYAQIAHEMLVRFDSAHTLKERLGACVTPYLYGRPWLEKPALYYWRAMFLFQDFGVHDWSARLPSTTFAFIMVALIYVHMRRFRPGGHLDAALITVACAGIIGFARGASTDMQMAAPLAIGLLGWYAWYETDSKFWLYDIYFFTGLATLAKGPVAPFLAALILVAFAFLRREWKILIRTLWWPGIVLYFAMVLPWFIAVQHQNPTFFREFFFEHNLQRFASDRYQHEQPFWYYLVVVLLAVMPWTVVAVKALVDGIQTSAAEWRLRYTRNLKPVNRPGDAFPEFLVLWALIPIVFFSFSQSKLPGYILPSIPPIAILTGDYLFRRRQPGLNRWVLGGHALVCAAVTMAAFTLPWFVAHGHHMPPAHVIVPAALAALGTALLILIVTHGFGVARLRLATSCVLAVLLLFLYGLGPVFFIPQVSATKQVINLLDRTYSVRPLADRLAEFVPPDGVVAVFRVRRETEYGLSFYRNREVVNYEESGVPGEQHLLVARMTGRNGVDLHTTEALENYLAGRQYSQLFAWPEQGLEVFLVGAR
ncbi:MAG TPA: glycosyltransferase family 39 protein [Terracidiphilus sp.]|nr:glycosyltransferase family 39 protein [Terracidiphilus sp.]